MTLSAAVNNLNNMETMLSTSGVDASDADFSAVLDGKLIESEPIESESLTIDDVKSNYTILTDKLVNFKEFLEQSTNEANVETSLDLTLAKDVTETLDNLQSNEPLESEDDEDNSNIIMFAQILETTHNDVSLELTEAQDVSEVSEIMETVPEVETSDVKTESESSEIALDEDMLEELNIESIKAETEFSGDDSSFMNRQSPEEQGIKFALHQEGVNTGVNAGTNKFTSNEVQTPVKTTEITPSKIIEQVSKHLESLQNTSKVSIVLNPESLGKVTIQLVKSPEGLSAQFTTATQDAKNLLMKGLDGLKDTLTSHGVGVDNVSVKISNTQKSEYNADWTEQEGSRGGNKEQHSQNREEKEKGLFEKTIAQQKENGKV